MRFLSALLFLSAAGLAGCPNFKTLDLEVASAGRPIRGAVATAVCDEHDGTAARSDERGHARLELRDRRRAHPCAITVASPGHDTARFEVDRFCERADCAPLEVELSGGDR